ncbi:MAG TPA: response regulator [Chthoniobacteraceae bacterium]|nr:response regulator [Chthoniobacteraceae bacterium]
MDGPKGNGEMMEKRRGLVEERNSGGGKTDSGQSGADLQKRFDALVREHAEVRRERDELAQRMANVPRSSADAAAQLAQAQKAIVSIRQARDSVVAQHHDLSNRLNRFDDQLAKLGYEKESAERARDLAVKQVQELTRELDELRRKALDLAEQKFAVLETGKDQSSALVTALQQVAVLTEERHLARIAAAEQNRMLEEVRAELEALRHAPPPGSAQLEGELHDARHKLGDLEAQMEGFKAQQKKNVLTLTKHLSSERDALRAKFDQERGLLEAQIATLRSELAGQSNNARLSEKIEDLRRENVELVAQLEAACAESAALRAALETKSALPIEAAPAKAKRSEAAPPAPARNRKNEAENRPEAKSSVAPLTDYDSSVTLGAMNSCLQMLSDHPTSVELLEELDNHLRGFSDRAESAKLAAVHRLSAGCAELTSWLRKNPAKIAAATLAPLEDAICLLNALTAVSDPAQILDPAGALVYAVDDDPDNCECIAMALEKMNLRTKYSMKPDVALTALSNTQCDLILLDVDLPGMNGFELSLRIRQIDRHVATPIVFVSALTSTKEKLLSNPNGANDFIAKPYNLTELGLKALTLILKARLNEPAAMAA